MNEHPSYRVALSSFLAYQEAQLHANDKKGDRLDWKDSSQCPMDHLLDAIGLKVSDLGLVLQSGDPEKIGRHCADIANYAMMIADNSEAL